MTEKKKRKACLFYEFLHLFFGCTLMFTCISDVVAGRIGLCRGMAAFGRFGIFTLPCCRVPPCLRLWVASPDADRLPVIWMSFTGPSSTPGPGAHGSLTSPCACGVWRSSLWRHSGGVDGNISCASVDGEVRSLPRVHVPFHPSMHPNSGHMDPSHLVV